MDLYKTAKESGFLTNKSVLFKSIDGIYIKKFRTIEDKMLPLGKNITLISGKNGTMKSSLLGLIAHPFSSPNEAKDLYGEDLKTKMSDVFRLSLEKDTQRYLYYLNASGVLNNNGKDEIIHFSEPIRIYPRPKEGRHRITVSTKNEEGYGNFHLNTSYVNLKRLFPIIDTQAIESTKIQLNDSRQNFIYDAYYRILQKETFKKALPVTDSSGKFTFGPAHDQIYNYNTISSGEDNLGNIINKLLAFMENKFSDNYLNGIFCIDEIEAGFHPIAQVKLFNYLLSWSKRYNVQIVATTHSLYLIQHALSLQENDCNNEIRINMISTANVRNNNYNIISNPNYNTAYKESTFKSIEELEETYKIKVLCEDEVAAQYIRKAIGRTSITKKLDFIYGITGDSNNPGTSASSLCALVKHGTKLLSDTLVVFDADINIEKYIQYDVPCFNLPIMYKLPIEKAIIKFIYDLPGDDPIFKKLDKEKDSFISDFSDYGIKYLDDLNRIKSAKVKIYKDWHNNNKSVFQRIMQHYISSHNELINSFKTSFIKQLNTLLKNKTLPTFKV